jgi:hypothetical protein
MDERTQLLKNAVAACFKARESVNVDNVRAKLPEDFFMDFDSGKPLTDAEVFSEIQASFMNFKKPVLDSGELLGDEPTDEPESLRDVWPPETVAVPVVEAAPVASESIASHEASGPGLSPQARLNAARKREQELIGNIGPLQRAHRDAMDALAAAKQDHQRHDPHRQTPEDVAREFREQSQRDRAARVKGAYQLTPVATTPRGEIAYVDRERMYSQGGDADAFLRSRAGTLNRRGAYSKQEAARAGFINRDPRRGDVPAPVVVPKPTIPALAK